jgi:hypothetical protein
MHIIRVANVYEPKIDAMPPEFRDVLTEQDVEAIRTGSKYFAKIAGDNSPKWLREVLAECAKGGYELQFYSSGDTPYRPYFRFYSQGQPAISLPRRKSVRPDIPAFLRQIYSVIGVFRENRFDEAGGLHEGDALVSVSETGMPVKPGSDISPDSAIPFLETYAGSQLCYLPDGSGAWLEACEFRRVDDLEHEIALYFEALLNGTRI